MVWIPPATENTARVWARAGREQVQVTGNLVPDAQLALLLPSSTGPNWSLPKRITCASRTPLDQPAERITTAVPRRPRWGGLELTSGRHTLDNAFQYSPGAQSFAGCGVWRVLVIGSQNCPLTQLSGSAEPIPAPDSDTASEGGHKNGDGGAA